MERGRVIAGAALGALFMASPAGAAPTALRLVAAPAPVTDALGRRWEPDAGALGGRITRGTHKVQRTASPQLYRFAREAVRGYDLSVAPGTYAVVLRFAETHPSTPGRRVFDVAAQGAVIAPAIDLARRPGVLRADQLVFTARVPDGSLRLRFMGRHGRPTVSAVEAERLSEATNPESLVWDDEFDRARLSEPDPARWTYDIGVGHPVGWGNDELERYSYSTANVRQDGQGALQIVARRRRVGGRLRYTSGRIETGGLFAFTSGRVEARIRFPAGRGLWPAFWAVGDDVEKIGWPAAGELDIAEVAGGRPSHVIASVHGPRSSGGGYELSRQLTTPRPVDQRLHDYGALRVPGAMEVTFDGRPYAAVTDADLGPGRPWVFDRPFRLVLNLAVGGTFGGPPDATTPFPATMSVDYVRVWR